LSTSYPNKIYCQSTSSGEEDELVALDQALGIFYSLHPPKEIHVIGGADHRLTDPAHRQRAIELSVDWFKKYL